MQHPELTLGEKIESIITTRQSGVYGEYLGASATTFGACRINEQIYKVRRNVEANSPWYWEVLDLNTGRTVQMQDRYDLCMFNGFDRRSADCA